MTGSLAPTLEAFFIERLVNQRHASPTTVAAYRDGWQVLLRYAKRPHRQATLPAGHRWTSPT